MGGFTWVLGSHGLSCRTRSLQYHCRECAYFTRRKSNDVACQIVDPWETGKLTQIPPGVKVTALHKGGPNESFTPVNVDDFIMASVHFDSFDQTALVALASLASDHVRLFG